MFCELTSSTQFGAIKFSNILPWETDGDIDIDQANYSSYLENVFPILSKLDLKPVSLIYGI